MIPFHSPESPEHGGRLEAAARKWGIPRSQWLDLSTGINPVPYPIPEIPMEVWQRLPEPDDGLEEIIRRWAGAPADAACLPVAGSQQAIMALPLVRKRWHGLGRVAVPMLGYREHGHAWQRAGFDVVGISAEQALADDLDWLDSMDVVVWINPNNPTGQVLSPERLLAWRERLARRGGWLVVDEAFVEVCEGHSLATLVGCDGLVVLKSVGKFFGLAGLRAGALLTNKALAHGFLAELGPWPVSGPARFLMTQMLEDQQWQAQTQNTLTLLSERMQSVLSDAGLGGSSGTLLFRYLEHPKAGELHLGLCRQGILVRLFEHPSAIRLGLPANEAGWRRLGQALTSVEQ